MNMNVLDHVPIQAVEAAQPNLGANGITLTPDQQAALESFTSFLFDPSEQVFVLEGYAGTGKSTLVDTLLQRLPGLQQMQQLINLNSTDYTVELTATTNKAAEALMAISKQPVVTIHSFLGLRVDTDYRTKEVRLISNGAAAKENRLIFIDEASYVDSYLLEQIFKLTKNCKIVFMGDPAQLTPVKSSGAPVFDAKFKTAKLTQVVRQAVGNPITTLATQFRETVSTGVWTSFKPDQQNVIYLPREEFEDKIIEEFIRADWKHSDSKILAWTNQRVVDYNHAVRDRVMGTPNFQVGDYVLNNHYVQLNKSILKTDQLLQITEIGEPLVQLGVTGREISFAGVRIPFFVPDSLAAAKAAMRKFRATNDERSMLNMAEWADLRAVYASTINKSQGSTYGKVYIDLDDIKRCNSGNQIARMMYVAVSRARHQVYLTGDLV